MREGREISQRLSNSVKMLDHFTLEILIVDPIDHQQLDRTPDGRSVVASVAEYVENILVVNCNCAEFIARLTDLSQIFVPLPFLAVPKSSGFDHGLEFVKTVVHHRVKFASITARCRCAEAIDLIFELPCRIQ